MTFDRYRLARVASAAVNNECETAKAFSKTYERIVEDMMRGLTFKLEAERFLPGMIARHWDDRATPDDRMLLRKWVEMLRQVRGRSERR